MSSANTVEELKSQLQTLPEPQRAEIASFLLESLHADHQDRDLLIRQTLARRREELRTGAVKGIPASEVFSEFDNR